MWDSLELVEKEAHTPKAQAARHLLECMMWPVLPTAREWLLAAWECSFARFPQDILDEIREVAQGWANNQPVESTHGVIADAARQSKAGKLTRMGKWHRI